MSLRYPLPVMVFATPMEAEPMLQRLPAELICHRPFKVYCTRANGLHTDLLILITGMGPDCAQRAMEFMITKFNLDRIVNCGIAGSLHDNPVIGTIFQVMAAGTVRSGNDERLRIGWTVANASIPSSLPLARLLSVNDPLFNNIQKRRLSSYAHLVDMEGAVIAKYCRMHDLPYRIVKIVSDDAENRELLLENLDRLSEQLADYIYQQINYFFPREVLL